MEGKDFEVQQLLKAYRKGLVSEELFAQQMDEMCATKNGQSAATNGQSAAPKASRPGGLRGVTGDAGLDAPGGMAKLMQKGRTYDRAAEDLGNIVALEHVNVTVPDQEKAALFYINGLGLTRDPYMMTGPANMWVNAGRQQFHLPTSKPQLLRGHVGVVVSDYEALPQRLGRIREPLASTRFECHERDGYVEAVCPWGNRIRCYAPNKRFGPMAVGIPYVEFDVPSGASDGIARFYTQIMGAQAAPLEDAHGRFACVTAGTGQNLFFRETDRPTQPYDQHHIQIYINDFSGPHRRLAAKGLIIQESDQHQYRFQDIVDPDNGKVLFTIEHEVRSMKHPLFLRPLVNRNPSQSIIGYAPGADAQNWAMASN
jgi:catechol 2,3-dioxygenase-like lactoylglutathione lyase family enzyme